jgi:type IV pilus assembly protein PilC
MDEGKSFSRSMEVSGGFSRYETDCIHVGENASCLSEVVVELSRYFTDKVTFRKKCLSALAYPFLVLLFALFAVVFMLRVVVPIFSKMFDRMGGKLPGMTRFVMDMAGHSHLLMALPVMIFLLVMVFRFLLKRETILKKRWDYFLVNVPYLGDMVLLFHLQRLFHLMKLLLAANIPVHQAIEASSRTISFVPLTDIWVRTMKDMSQGFSLHQCLSRHAVFDTQAIAMIKAGEEVNKLHTVFVQLHSMADRKWQDAMALFFVLLEPTLIAITGGLVAFILLSLYLPVFQMGHHIR